MSINIGDIVEGKITGIKEYGVFADIGDGKSGMVHISEVSRTYVSDIHEHIKENEVYKMKVLGISDDGKISLSIKKALPPEEKTERKARGDKGDRKRTPVAPPKPDNSFVWMPKKNESSSFEDMMNQFKATSDEKFSDLKRKNVETKRPRRGVGSGK